MVMKYKDAWETMRKVEPRSWKAGLQQTPFNRNKKDKGVGLLIGSLLQIHSKKKQPL
jgi:hypothetical protein